MNCIFLFDNQFQTVVTHKWPATIAEKLFNRKSCFNDLITAYRRKQK